MRGIQRDAAGRVRVLRWTLAGAVAVALLIAPAGASALAMGGAASVVPAVGATPVVTSLSPSQGSGIGGTKVTILGENLRGVTTVTFGSTAVRLAKPNKSSTKLKVVAPPGTGTVDVIVSSLEAGSEAVAADRYTYTSALPTVTRLGPSFAPAHEQESVKITGQNLTGAKEVRFGGKSVPFVVMKATEIFATAPLEQVQRTVDVTVVTPQGISAISAADRYEFRKQLPSIADVAPDSGFVGQKVTLIGKGFIGASEAQVGEVPVEHLEVLSDTELSFVVPPHAAEFAWVSVTNPFGEGPEGCFRSPKCPPNPHFKIFPLITSVFPGAGPVAGGTLVTLTGSGFSTAEDRVYFDEKQVIVACESTSVCEVLSPEDRKGAGTVPVEIHVPTNYNSAESHSPLSEATVFTYE